MATLLNGRLVSTRIYQSLKERIIAKKLTPTLSIILIGERKDSQTYVNIKKKKCLECGIINQDFFLPTDVKQEKVETLINKLNNDDKVDGILVQLPLPKHLDESYLLSLIDHKKDVDGFHQLNFAKLALNQKPYLAPCTPEGIIRLLQEYKIEIEGKHVVIVGRSKIVGLPVSLLMLHHNATVTICHSKTENISKITQEADILVVAVGKKHYLTGKDIKDGAVVVDVGINVEEYTDEEGNIKRKLYGDVDTETAKLKASYITPVPGGVGPMTVALLLEHVVDIAESKLLD